MAAPADPQSGVGFEEDQDTLFSGFGFFLGNQPAAANAGAFQESGPAATAPPYPSGSRLTAPGDILTKTEGDPPSFVTATGVPQVQYAQGGSLVPDTTYYYEVTAVSASGESAPSAYVLSATAQTENILSIQPYPFATSYNVYRGTELTNGTITNPFKMNTSAIIASPVVMTVTNGLTLPAGTIDFTVPPGTDMSNFPKIGTLQISGTGDTPQTVQYTGLTMESPTHYEFSGVTFGSGTFGPLATMSLLPQYVDTGSTIPGATVSTLVGSVTPSSTTITVALTSGAVAGFPASGFLLVSDGSTTDIVHYDGFDSKAAPRSRASPV